MTSREAALSVVVRLREAGFEAYFAGGCVRDRLLAREPGDHDVATNAIPDQVQKLFRRNVAVGKQFGVILVLVGDIEVEVATFRADAAYTDGRRPDAVTFSDMATDVQRRDFTINGMLEDPVDGRIVDLVRGQEDVRARLIRAIGDPEKRFDEDRLRMLRAVRFAAQLGFAIEPATLAAITRRAAEVSTVSRERIKEELDKTLRATDPATGLRLFRETGLLGPIVAGLGVLPDDRWNGIVAAVARLQHRTAATSLAALLHDLNPEPAQSSRAADAVLRDLRASNEERERVSWLVAHHDDPLRAATMRASEWKPLLAHPGARELLDLFEATHPGESSGVLRERLSRTDLDPPRLVTGDDLMAIGAPKGPALGRILTALRAAQLDGEIGTAEEAKAMALRLAADRK